MKFKVSHSWYNYAQEDWEELTETPTDFKPYIPQSPAAQNMYALLTEKMGHTPIDAALKVLSAACGNTD